MNLRENIPTNIKRRTHLIDRVIHIMLQNMYPCDYNSSDHFVEGVLDEIRWFLLDVEELQGIERADIENYILDYKYDELTNYFNEHCIVLKNDNLQESIRRILREDKDYTKLLKSIIDTSDIFDYKYFCGVDIITPEERSDQHNFLNKNKIPYLIKVYFVGGPNSEVWPRTQAIRNKELDLIEELHEYITSFVPFNIEMMGSHVNSCEGYDRLMKRKYSTDDLQESIKRILREETYSPAGNEYTPGRYVVHKSAPQWRENIELTGLQTSVGDCYQIYAGGDVKCKKSIFATDSLDEKDMFDSTYDDDIWLIDTECAGVSWFKDKHFESNDYSHHIVTFENISPNCLKLIHKGTGKEW